jgi:ABC-2 type transport system permease protein
LKVAIVDPSNSSLFTKAILDSVNNADPSSDLQLTSESIDSANYTQKGYDGFIELPAMNWESPQPQEIILHARKSYGDGSTNPIKNKLNTIWDKIKSEKLGIDDTKKAILTKGKLELRSVNDKDNADAKTAQGIAYACGFLIYFIMLIYGSQVMMGVMEEKTNRIAEVIVSSVRPFQMMLGKIIGIGLVALTQFFLWIAFVLVIYNVSKASGGGGMANAIVGGLQDTFAGVNVPFIIFCFAFYFLAGFFFYASLYGAIGSAVNEDMREAQSLSFPITMLIIISIALMSSAIANPTSPVAVWASIIPFSAPIVMMARIPYGVPGTVPWWQLGLSMSLLVLGFIFTTWFAAKIYRTGILMYGKKPTWKEMIKWAFRKS